MQQMVKALALLCTFTAVSKRIHLYVSGQRGLTSTHSSSVVASCAGRCSHRPSRMRSMPAHATITPLSVHSFGGGTASSSPCFSATACQHTPMSAMRPKLLWT